MAGGEFVLVLVSTPMAPMQWWGMETPVLASLIAGMFSLCGVIFLGLLTWRQSGQTIRSNEAIALRDSMRKDSGEIRAEQVAIKLELQRCNEDRAADALQRKADAERHMADEDQRRVDDERHRADEQRHVVDSAEITNTRTEIAAIRADQAEVRRKLRSMADAARIFGEETATAQEIDENESHP